MNIRSRTLLGKIIACLGMVYLSAMVTPAAWAENTCRKWTANVSGQLQSPVGPIDGVVEITFENGEFLPLQVLAVITANKVTPDGTIHLDVTTFYTFPDGSTAIGIDKVTAPPTGIPGEYGFNVHVNIIGKTGVAENAFGKYHGTGYLSFNDLKVSHSGHGKICLDKP